MESVEAVAEAAVNKSIESGDPQAAEKKVIKKKKVVKKPNETVPAKDFLNPATISTRESCR